MSHIVIFCDKNIKETNDKIDQTDSTLKTMLEKAEYEEIQKTIVSNETATNKILRQYKFNKWIFLNPNPNQLLKL